MHLKGGLHCHSTCSDGKLSIEEVVEVYESLGFDFIALTDHDHLLRPDCYEVVDRLQTDLIIFTGVELTVFEKGYVHINRIPGDRETLHVFNHPAELELPVEKVIERIGAIAARLPLDVVEITLFGFRTPEFDIPEIPYPKLAADDSHTRIGCGRAWIELDCRRDKDSILRAVRQGDFWNCYAERG
jgi:predicted metal-dependent phosphoesterase TrpH